MIVQRKFSERGRRKGQGDGSGVRRCSRREGCFGLDSNSEVSYYHTRPSHETRTCCSSSLLRVIAMPMDSLSPAAVAEGPYGPAPYCFLNGLIGGSPAAYGCRGKTNGAPAGAGQLLLDRVDDRESRWKEAIALIPASMVATSAVLIQNERVRIGGSTRGIRVDSAFVRGIRAQGSRPREHAGVSSRLSARGCHVAHQERVRGARLGRAVSSRRRRGATSRSALLELRSITSRHLATSYKALVKLIQLQRTPLDPFSTPSYRTARRVSEFIDSFAVSRSASSSVGWRRRMMVTRNLSRDR